MMMMTRMSDYDDALSWNRYDLDEKLVVTKAPRSEAAHAEGHKIRTVSIKAVRDGDKKHIPKRIAIPTAAEVKIELRHVNCGLEEDSRGRVGDETNLSYQDSEGIQNRENPLTLAGCLVLDEKSRVAEEALHRQGT